MMDAKAWLTYHHYNQNFRDYILTAWYALVMLCSLAILTTIKWHVSSILHYMLFPLLSNPSAFYLFISTSVWSENHWSFYCLGCSTFFIMCSWTQYTNWFHSLGSTSFLYAFSTLNSSFPFNPEEYPIIYSLLIHTANYVSIAFSTWQCSSLCCQLLSCCKLFYPL